MENADEDLKLLITEICYLAKSLNLFYHLELAVELLHEWEISDSFNLRRSAEREMWLQGERAFRKVIYIYIFFCLLTVFLAIGSTTLSGTPTLLYQFWLPAKWREYNIWPAFFYESLSLNFNCMCNVVLDSFQCYLLYHLSLYTRLIGMRMERLGYEKTNVETTSSLENIIDMHQRLKA
ncbi:odorant receptor 94b-like [Ceratitis capitata]|nr:odorant receptor 94b-like [Ceratitis capitata]